MKRPVKGHYGYLEARKRQLLIRALVLLAGVTALIVTGILVTGERLNWMTVFGALTAVPMAMQFASFFALTGYRTGPEEEFREVQALTGNGVLDADIVVGNPKGRSYHASYVYFHEDGIFAYTPDMKTAVHEMETYFRNYLRLHECDGPLTVCDQFGLFLKKLKALPPSDRDTVPERVLRQEGVFRAIAM
ncbi:MAG: hypothetical protein J6Z23_05095 [Lachnospiraceae bacterium]|nr:hypothetical protein [Lachnospiraceae bacterium]